MAREGEAMDQQSMWKAARLVASDIANARSWLGVESGSDRRSRSSCSRVCCQRPLVAQHMSTGPSGDCETRFLLDDSDVSATESRPISLFRALSDVDRPMCRS